MHNQRKRHVHIDNPNNNTDAARQVDLDGTATGQVQLYVRASDNLWYLQPPVTSTLDLGWCMDNSEVVWVGTAYLGDLAARKGRGYTIAAVLTSERPETPLKQLPRRTPNHRIKVKLKRDNALIEMIAAGVALVS